MGEPIVDAIYDLTRVVIAVQGDLKSKAEVIRRLNELAIPPVRIASILAMDPKDVHSSLAKARKQKSKNRRNSTAIDAEESANGEG
jgi:hypothetical protein